MSYYLKPNTLNKTKQTNKENIVPLHTSCIRTSINIPPYASSEYPTHPVTQVLLMAFRPTEMQHATDSY